MIAVPLFRTNQRGALDSFRGLCFLEAISTPLQSTSITRETVYFETPKTFTFFLLSAVSPDCRLVDVVDSSLTGLRLSNSFHPLFDSLLSECCLCIAGPFMSSLSLSLSLRGDCHLGFRLVISESSSSASSGPGSGNRCDELAVVAESSSAGTAISCGDTGSRLETGSCNGGTAPAFQASSVILWLLALSQSCTPGSPRGPT